MADVTRDDFWDIAALLPRKKTPPAATPTRTPVRVAEVEVPARGAEQATPATPLTTPAAGAWECVRDYLPKNNLFRRVRVFHRAEPYNFYGRFCTDAARYLQKEGEECPFVHFFSYIPQYAQLNEAQRQYYFYWRTALRRGEYLRCDESYLYLYIYEVINLTEHIPPAEGIGLLCRAWAAYRKRFPRLDKYMTEWVMDYCLCHAVPLPEELLRPFRPEILSVATCPEFYLGEMGELTPEGVDTALSYFSDYAFRTSRYTERHMPLFERHILAALRPVLSALLEAGERPLCEGAATCRRREAFCGSLCAHHIKSRLEIEYVSLSDMAPYRRRLTAAVKYAENRLRAHLGVKSRLSPDGLTEADRAAIDAYFASVQEELSPRTPPAPTAYDHLYDAPARPADFGEALALEGRSWEVTRWLISDTEEEEPPSAFSVAEEKTDRKFTADSVLPTPAPTEGDTPALTPEERKYLATLLQDRQQVFSFLSVIGRMEEELVEAINEKAMATLGDAVIEDTGEGYAVITDYQSEVTQWIS